MDDDQVWAAQSDVVTRDSPVQRLVGLEGTNPRRAAVRRVGRLARGRQLKLLVLSHQAVVPVRAEQQRRGVRARPGCLNGRQLRGRAERVAEEPAARTRGIVDKDPGVGEKAPVAVRQALQVRQERGRKDPARVAVPSISRAGERGDRPNLTERQKPAVRAERQSGPNPRGVDDAERLRAGTCST